MTESERTQTTAPDETLAPDEAGPETEAISKNQLPAMQASAPVALRPTDVDGAWRLSQLFAKSAAIPQSYFMGPNDKRLDAVTVTANVFLGIQTGAELGLSPIQALSTIAVINGRPSLWGDGLLAVVRASKKCGAVNEWIEGEGPQRVAYCETYRTDTQETIKRSFSWEDADKAKLTGKDPWMKYPARMLQMRARAFCLRDAYADLLKGIKSGEEMLDVTDYSQNAAGDYVPTTPTRESVAKTALKEVEVEAPVVVEVEPKGAPVDLTEYDVDDGPQDDAQEAFGGPEAANEAEAEAEADVALKWELVSHEGGISYAESPEDFTKWVLSEIGSSANLDMLDGFLETNAVTIAALTDASHVAQAEIIGGAITHKREALTPKPEKAR